jgi:hypothetical protein
MQRLPTDIRIGDDAPLARRCPAALATLRLPADALRHWRRCAFRRCTAALTTLRFPPMHCGIDPAPNTGIIGAILAV